MFVIGGQREHAVMPDPHHEAPAGGGGSTATGRLAAFGPDPFASLEEAAPVVASEPDLSPPPAPERSAETPDSIMQVIRGGGGDGAPPEVSMRVVHGGQDESGGESSAAGTGGAELVLGDEVARQLAEDLVAALAATYPEKITRARNDGQWEFHLGDVIRDARDDFRAALAAGDSDRDELFNGALRHLLSRGAAAASPAPADADDAEPGSSELESGG